MGGKGQNKSNAESVIVDLPVIVNVKAVKANEELLMYRPAPAKKAPSKRSMAMSLKDSTSSKQRR